MFSLSVLALLCLRSVALVNAALYVCLKPFSFSLTQKINIYVRFLIPLRVQPVRVDYLVMYLG